MDSKVLEIIDTSIKIGLGALIGAVSAYVITRVTHRAKLKEAFSDAKSGLKPHLLQHLSKNKTL